MKRNICKKCDWLVDDICKNGKVDTTDKDGLDKIFDHAGVKIITVGCDQFKEVE